MLTLLHEIHFWTLKDAVTIRDTDLGAFKYYDKKLLPQDVFFNGKKTYMLERGMTVVPCNKRPTRLRDSLKELEDLLCRERIVSCEWKSSSHLTILIASGLKVSVQVNSESGDILEICYDKFMLGKLASHYLSDVGLSKNQAIFSYTDNQVTLVNFSKPAVTFEADKKWSGLEGRVGTVELAGPLGRRVDRLVSYSSDATMVLVWWKCSRDEVYPWTPAVRDQDRSNVHIYTVQATKLDLRCYFSTEHDPLYISFSSVRPHIVHSIQQRISPIGEVTLEWSIIEISEERLETAYILSLLLPSHTSALSLSPREDFIFIGCIDGSILIADCSNNVSELKKAFFIPSLASWHPDSSLILVCGERGQMQWFDRALQPLRSGLVGEEAAPSTILDLSSYFKYQPLLLSASWNRRSAVETSPRMDHLILLRFERGPLVGVKVVGGGTGEGLNPPCLLRQYLAAGSEGEALLLLLSLSWTDQDSASTTLLCLQLFVSALIKLPLTPQREDYLEKALGSYHKPRQPIPEAVLDEVADSVHDLSRRFFHHLLRYGLCEKALSLAVDLADYDLFMDLHNYGKLTGDPGLARTAVQKAEQICVSSSYSSSEASCDCSESCSCSSEEEEEGRDVRRDMRRRQRGTSSPPPLPVLPPPPPPSARPRPPLLSPASLLRQVKFSSTVTHIAPQPSQMDGLNEMRQGRGGETDRWTGAALLRSTGGGNAPATALQSTIRSLPPPSPSPAVQPLPRKSEEVETGKIKVVHFGLV